MSSSIIPPTYFIERSKELEKVFTTALNNVVKSFPLQSTYTSYAKYKKDYDAAVSLLQTVQNSYNEMKTELILSLETLNSRIHKVDRLTNDTNEQNKELRQRIKTEKGDADAADGSLDDSHNLYKQQFLSNVLLCLLVIYFGVLFYKNSNMQLEDIKKSYSICGILCLLTFYILVFFVKFIWKLLVKGFYKVF